MKIYFKKLLPNLRLGTKAALAAVVALILVSTAFTSLFYFFHKQSSIQELCNRALSLANNLVYNSYYAVISSDLETLNNLAKGLIQERDIENVLITDKEKRILATTDTLKLGSTILFELPDTLLKNFWISSTKPTEYRAISTITIEKKKLSSDESFLFLPMQKSSIQTKTTFISPNEEIIGFVIFEVSLLNLEESLSKYLRKAIIITFLIILIGGFLTTILVEKIVQPLQLLSNATKEIAKGDFGKLIPINRTDEIGTLAESFNYMTKQLKKSRDDYEALNSELEFKVAESTSELRKKYQELEKTLESLKTKDSTKYDFLALISHEMRAPLSSIQLFSEMMLRGFDKVEKRQDYLSMIVKNCQRLSRLINDVLDCLKIESGKIRFCYEEFNFIEVLNEAILSLEPNMESKNIRCNRCYDEEEIILWSDKDRSVQVLTNILSNAINFSYERSHIDIALKNLTNSIEISVKDYGKGIKREDIHKVFDKFSQIERVYKDSIGTGLGMSITKSIIEYLGGKIWIESQIGKGTTVSFTLAKRKQESL